MNLKSYLAEIHMTIIEFAQIIDANPGYLSRIINGHKKPGKRLAKEIERVTDGVVMVPEDGFEPRCRCGAYIDEKGKAKAVGD